MIRSSKRYAIKDYMHKRPVDFCRQAACAFSKVDKRVKNRTFASQIKSSTYDDTPTAKPALCSYPRSG